MVVNVRLSMRPMGDVALRQSPISTYGADGPQEAAARHAQSGRALIATWLMYVQNYALKVSRLATGMIHRRLLAKIRWLNMC